MAGILFVCTGNACRSPMAEGWARTFGLKAESAGVVAAGVHPRAVEVMAEKGIDISRHRSRTVPEADSSYDFVVTLCDYAASVYPDTPRARGARLHWPVDDPITARGTPEEIRAEFRRARDQIEDLIRRHLDAFRSLSTVRLP